MDILVNQIINITNVTRTYARLVKEPIFTVAKRFVLTMLTISQSDCHTSKGPLILSINQPI
jgi:hypothetical protein